MFESFAHTVHAHYAIVGLLLPKLAHRLSYKDYFGDHANTFTHQKCMCNNFKPIQSW